MEKITQKKKYFVVRERAVPEVLLKVVQAKKLLDSEKVSTVQEARGKTITFIIQMDDEPGILSVVLQTIAHFHGNILTIHQSIPINGIATLTLSVDILPGEGDAEAMIEEIESQEGIHYLKILGRE